MSVTATPKPPLSVTVSDRPAREHHASHDDEGARWSAGESGGRESIAELFARLTTDVRDLARAEVSLVRARTMAAVRSAGISIGMLVAAWSIVQGALVALLVGLIFVLTPSIGAVWATVTVVIGALAIAGLLAWLGLRGLKGDGS